jgi:hypothetical protein
MSFKDWLQRSWGRMRESKKHLLATARLLDLDPSVIDRMERSGRDECEAILVEQVEAHHGGTVDWRATLDDVVETIDSVLTPGERAALAVAHDTAPTSLEEAVQLLDRKLINCHRGLRALESFGDNLIVLLVPRPNLAPFDDANRHWMA